MQKDQGSVRDERGQTEPKDRQPKDKQRAQDPAAGPHAKRELTDKHKTPGAGTLPEPGTSDDSTSG